MTDTNKTFKPMSDARLLSMHLQSGTNEYLGELYDRYVPLVYGVALKYLRTVDDAGDAVMSIFEELPDKVEKYEILEFGPWLYDITKNYCMRRLRKKKREIPADLTNEIVEAFDMTHLLSGGKDGKLFEALERCVEKLPKQQRECITFFFFQNKSYADIAAATCYHLNNVKGYIRNGKQNLKICIAKDCNEID